MRTRCILDARTTYGARSTYVVEDLHTMMMTSGRGGYGASAKEFYDIMGEAFWSMHYYWGNRYRALDTCPVTQ